MNMNVGGRPLTAMRGSQQAQLAPAARRPQHAPQVVLAAGKRGSALPSRDGKAGRRPRGFGGAQRQGAGLRRVNADRGKDDLDDEDESPAAVLRDLADDDAGGGSGAPVGNAQPGYQLYTDTDYKPARFIGPVDVGTVTGHGRALQVSEPGVAAGQLLVLSPALAMLQGEWKATPPEPEDLQNMWLEDEVQPAQRRVLAGLYDGTDESMAQPLSLPTLDAKFWASRGRNDPQAPQISARKLLSIIQEGACADMEEDAAACTVRHQRPSSYIGLWPEYTLLNHSCLPNVSLVVVGDRMLIHAAREMVGGEELTRNYVPHLSTAPAAERQAGLTAAGYSFHCDCPRCRLEEGAPEEVKEILQAAYSWYTAEALPRFNAANAAEDLGPLRELQGEAAAIVDELEALVDAQPDLSDPQRTLLRAAAYDTYDMLLMCDEFVNQGKASLQRLLACLELVAAIAPGSESHAAVALKYQRAVTDRLQLAEALAKRDKNSARSLRTEMGWLAAQQTLADEYYTEAWVARYGFVSFPTLQALTEGYEVYVEAVEQMSVMQAMGVSESVSELEINGVRVSVVDKMEVGDGDGSPASGLVVTEATGRGAATEVVSTATTRDGTRVTLVQGMPGEGSRNGSGTGGDGEHVTIDVEAQEVQTRQGSSTGEGGLAEMDSDEGPGDAMPAAPGLGAGRPGSRPTRQRPAGKNRIALRGRPK